jgi:pyridoxine 4-dehydrogenase
MTTTSPPAAQAGSYRVGGLNLNRIGYGAMQLAGPGVFGPPRDRAAAIEVVRTAVVTRFPAARSSTATRS